MTEAIEFLSKLEPGTLDFQTIYMELKEMGFHHQEASQLAKSYARDEE